MSVTKKRTDYVAANQVQVDPKVQRDLMESKVEKIIAEFDPQALGVIAVSQRANGGLFCIDGQHRVAALLKMDQGDFFLEAEIYEGLSLADEAKMFRLRNNRTAVNLADLFMVRTIEGEPTALAIQSILDRFGWKVITSNSGKTPGSFRSIGTMDRLFQVHGAEVAERTVMILTRAWGHTPNAMVGPLLAGLGNLLGRYGVAVDTESMIDKLSKYEGGAANLWANARGYRATVKTTAPDAVSDLIVRAYNVSKRSGALPDWR